MLVMFFWLFRVHFFFFFFFFFFFNDTATTEIYTLSLHDALPITGLNPSRTYYVAIRATDDAANVSALSNVPSGTTLDTIPPAPVRDLSMDPDSGTVDPIVSAAQYEVASNAR